MMADFFSSRGALWGVLWGGWGLAWARRARG
jgi:hypothetical protein